MHIYFFHGRYRWRTGWLVLLCLMWLLPQGHAVARQALPVPARQPHRPSLASEFRSLLPQWLVARAGRRQAKRTPRPRHGRGHNVIVVPGMFSSDLFYRRMRTTLARAGLKAQRSTIRFNLGGRKRVERLKRRAIAVHRQNGKPVQFLGHSLGGALAAVAAQELATEHPEVFRGLGQRPHLVTLSAPINVAHKNDGAHPLVGRIGRLMRRGIGEVEPSLKPLAHASSRKIRMVTTTSAADGVIYPEAASLTGVRNVQLQHATHLSMPFHPRAIQTAIRSLTSAASAR